MNEFHNSNNYFCKVDDHINNTNIGYYNKTINNQDNTIKSFNSPSSHQFQPSQQLLQPQQGFTYIDNIHQNFDSILGNDNQQQTQYMNQSLDSSLLNSNNNVINKEANSYFELSNVIIH